MQFITQLFYPIRAMAQEFLLFPAALQPHWGLDLLTVDVSRSHTVRYAHTHTHRCTRWDSSGRVISPTQRPLPDNTKLSQETDIHPPAGFEPEIPANDPHPRSLGHRDRRLRGLDTGISPRIPAFLPRSVRAGFFGGRAALGKIFLKVLLFS